MNFKNRTISFISTLLPVFLLVSCATQEIVKDGDQATDSEIQSFKAELFNIDSVEEALFKGKAALKENKTDLAQAYYITAYEMEPDNLLVLIEMVNLYEATKNHEMLLLSYQLILDQQPDNIDILEKAGLLLIKLNNYQEAEKKLLKVINSPDGNTRWLAYNGLGVIADLSYKHQEAINYYKQADLFNPNYPEILNNIGYSLYMDNQFDEALDYFNRALQINPRYNLAMYNFALAKARQGKYKQAVEAFSRVTDQPEAYNNTGYIAMMNGDNAQASYFFHEALKSSPRFYKKAYENIQMLDGR